MSELLARIKADMLTARKARDSESVKSYSTLIGEIELIGKKPGKSITDELVIATIKKFIANLNEAIGYSSGGTMDMMEEVKLLEQYLPTQMDEHDIRKVIMCLPTPVDMGACMKFLKMNYAGQYDGKLASQVVKAYLN